MTDWYIEVVSQEHIAFIDDDIGQRVLDPGEGPMLNAMISRPPTSCVACRAPFIRKAGFSHMVYACEGDHAQFIQKVIAAERAGTPIGDMPPLYEDISGRDFAYGYEDRRPELFCFGFTDETLSKVGWMAYVCEDCAKQPRRDIEAVLAGDLAAEHQGAVPEPSTLPDDWFFSEEHLRKAQAAGREYPVSDDSIPF
jgi:hypothetical protein